MKDRLSHQDQRCQIFHWDILKNGCFTIGMWCWKIHLIKASKNHDPISVFSGTLVDRMHQTCIFLILKL